MKRYTLILLLFSSIIVYGQSDSTEIKLKQYKDMFSNGLINETEYTKLKQKVLFPSPNSFAQPETHSDKDKIVKSDTVKNKIKNKGYFFISPSIVNGYGTINYYSGDFVSKVYKGYFLSNNFLLGYSIRGFSISAGIKGKIYFTRSNNLNQGPEDPTIIINGTKSKHYFISVPLMLDYNINVSKNKIFILVGVGAEYNALLRQDLEVNGVKYRDVLSTYYKDFNSFGIIGRVGLKYVVNQRIDVFTNFSYERNLITAFKYKPNPNADLKVIPTSYSFELGIDIKLKRFINK